MKGLRLPKSEQNSTKLHDATSQKRALFTTQTVLLDLTSASGQFVKSDCASYKASSEPTVYRLPAHTSLQSHHFLLVASGKQED
jgi:hypothetical protein